MQLQDSAYHGHRSRSKTRDVDRDPRRHQRMRTQSYDSSRIRDTDLSGSDFSSEEPARESRKKYRRRKHRQESRQFTDCSSNESDEDPNQERRKHKKKSKKHAPARPEGSRTKNGLRIGRGGEIELPYQTAILFAERQGDVRLRGVRRRLLKGSKTRDVFLKIYDITDGRASQWLKPLMGTQIEGIWHTGVLVHGKEHFYCDGIQSLTPDVVELKFAMQLRDILYLGKTSLSRSKVQAILNYSQHTFTPESYDLIKWNCNHFTEAFLADLFRTRKPVKSSAIRKFGQSEPRLPIYVVEQPDQFMATVRGRILIWMVKNVLEKVDNFLNDHFQAGLDNIIDRWFRARE